MTNERNPKSPRALMKFRTESAAAAARAQEEAEVLIKYTMLLYYL
jgi:hypothetical protein